MMTTDTADNNKQKLETDKWGCPRCTFQNEYSRTHCEICEQDQQPEYIRHNSNQRPQSSSDITAAYASNTNHNHSSSNPRLDSGKSTLSKIEFSSKQYEKENTSIPDLPLNGNESSKLERQICERIESVCRIQPIDVKCYLNFGFGVIRVANEKEKDSLVTEIVSITLDKQGTRNISFVATLDLVSYIVLDENQDNDDTLLPTGEELSRRMSKLYNGERPRHCNQLNAQFPNIYRVVFTSFDQLVNNKYDNEFSISGRFAHAYFCAGCSFLEDLPRSLNEDQLRKAISTSIGLSNLSSSFLYVQLNKHSGSACILVTDTARAWSAHSDLTINGKLYSKRDNLSCRLSVYPITPSFSVRNIINHPMFVGKVTNYKQIGENLILELSDKNIFDKCVTNGMLRIDDKLRLLVGVYNPLNNPEGSEIDNDTWYETEMSRYKSDIMQFVSDPKHPIFRYKWNSEIWLQNFKQTLPDDHENKNVRDRKETETNKTRHMLRVSVMLNTIGVILKGSYMIDDREVKLNLDSQMKTIVYDHRSKLERCERMPETVPPYKSTRVEVLNEDCLLVYERLTKSGQRPLLLNMANATSPGGGYRKGDGAQEENLFRRSDYCRSLDVGLDNVHKQPSKRYYCSSNCQLDPLSDDNNMYPMQEFGAIYTSDYQKHIQPHCKEYRHCTPQCQYGNHCAYFHDKEHMDEFEHPFPIPCPFTPFHCKSYDELSEATDSRRLSSEVQQHCLDYTHVCRTGRHCNNTNSLHLEKSIHIARHFCPDGNKCKKLTNEDHLNSFTHYHVDDIRLPCRRHDLCHDRRKLDHVVKFRHAVTFEHSGILHYNNLNEGVDFVQNQKDIIARVTAYVKQENWKPLPSGGVPREIIEWLNTVQPIHRCNPIVFESILIHGHVMSREYMVKLKYSKSVAKSVLQHGRIRRIRELREKIMEEHARQYIIALVEDIFEKEGFYTYLATATAETADGDPSPAHIRSAVGSEVLQTKDRLLSAALKSNDMDAIRSQTSAIARASINLHTNPSGIGFTKDKLLETDKSVFSVLGPNLGHYYGDIIIVFKREILHHPDANFSIQAATSFASGNAFVLRPWLGTDPGSLDERVKLYHQSKLNASVPGYEHAAALELIAFSSFDLKLNTLNIDLDKIFKRWVTVDAHLTVEGHLPQLIPLSYIDHVYIPKNLYESFSDDTHKAINANFKRNCTIVPFDGEANQSRGPHGPIPKSKSRADYQDFVIKELFKQYAERREHSLSRAVRGIAITLPSTDFTDHYVLPLTISQAYEQYRFEKNHRPRGNMTYIYWQILNGDMMLTLSNERLQSVGSQPDLRCLTCYIAPKPTPNSFPYHEKFSYLNNQHPFRH
ncbi:unnamed protein product, partial [Rotaria magnacalcarata]